jgi:hypothetical protein
LNGLPGLPLLRRSFAPAVDQISVPDQLGRPRVLASVRWNQRNWQMPSAGRSHPLLRRASSPAAGVQWVVPVASVTVQSRGSQSAPTRRNAIFVPSGE